MKRRIGKLLACALAGVMLVGCGSTESGGETVSGQEKVDKKSEKGATTIYVATTQETTYHSGTTGASYVNFQLNEDGVIITQNTKNTYEEEDGVTELESTFTYVIDHENLMRNIDMGKGNDNTLSKQYESFIKAQKHISEDVSSFYILSLNNQQKICRDVGSNPTLSWKEMCEGGGVVHDFLYDEAGNRVESITFSNGNIFSILTQKYNSANNLTSQKLSQLFLNQEYNWEYLYNSDNRISNTYYSISTTESGLISTSHDQYFYNENGQLEEVVTAETNNRSLYKYDDNGKLIKVSAYLGDGTLSNVTSYTYEEIKVPNKSVEFLCHLYDHVGMQYEILE